jgi:hypothetical protein
MGLECLYMAVRPWQRVFGGNERSGLGIILQEHVRESYPGSGALWLTTAESTGDVCMIIYLFFYLDPNIFISGTHARYRSVLSRYTRKPTPPLPGWDLRMSSRVR